MAVASRVGVQAHPLKQAGVVATERLSRFKIDHRMTGSSQLSLLLELELLYLGIQASRCYGRTLHVVARNEPRLAEFDFGKIRPCPGAVRCSRAIRVPYRADTGLVTPLDCVGMQHFLSGAATRAERPLHVAVPFA